MLHTPLNAAGIETDPPSYRSRSATEMQCDAIAFAYHFQCRTQLVCHGEPSMRPALPCIRLGVQSLDGLEEYVPPEEPPDDRLRLYGFLQYPMMLLFVSGDCHVSATRYTVSIVAMLTFRPAGTEVYPR